jgi:subtilase family serine protease
MFKLLGKTRLVLLVIATTALLGSAFSARSQRLPLQTAAAAPANARVASRLPNSQILRLNLSLPMRNQQQLKVLLQQIQTLGSPQYRKYLTVQQFTNQFAPTATDYAKVISFAQAHRLSVVRTFSNRLVVNVSGSAFDIGQAFHLNMQRYQHPT